MAFVVSQGQVVALNRATVSVATSMSLTDTYSAAYDKIWRSHGNVRTVTGFLGRNIASLGLHLFERVGDTDRRRNTEHPIARLMSRPHPAQTRYDFIDALVQDLAIYDRYLAVKLKANGGSATQALVRVPPALWEPVGDDWLFPEGFKVKGTKGSKVFTWDQVVYIGGYSPTGELGGVSPIESLRTVLAEEFEAAKMRAQTFRNGARTSGYIERPAGPEWSTKARDRFRAGWRAQYTGNGPDAGGTPILEDGMKFVQASQSAKDLQYIESRKLTREEVASAYYIPPPMIGLLDRATFSNIKEQHKHLYQDTLGPWLQRIQQALVLHLWDDFPDTDGLYLEFNIEEKLRGSFEEQAQQMQAAVGGPYMSRNEARARMNLPAVEGGDELIVPLNVLTGGQSSPQDSGTQNLAAAPARVVKAIKAAKSTEYEIKAVGEDDVPEEHSDELAKLFRKFFARQRAAVLAAAGAKAAAWWDQSRWDDELATDLLEQALTVSTAAALGVLADLGVDTDGYSTERTEAFLKKVTQRIAGQVNGTTYEALAAAFESADPDAAAHVFDVAEESRADKSGMTAAATFVGFGLVEGPRQTRPQAQKRWQVNSGNPRASHASMNGETVGIDDDFSNGMPWPGSFTGDADDVANCQCSVVIIT